ncbi:lytic transglycosylase domain-containing protein [Bombella sp. TMW 2.2559]|uniref:Lytic transglycosylase domain-containing protein n=1 Tax=Bombella dulcis TaxID=2967339 RepID=A0ABT3W9B1_9PROT|nr:lytic transglycosylase domain-containing protein [Bombella dulcis]MCX5615669.1 lytic transglycosylase domain-containing protein [Bombella dulcis]
MAFSAVCPAATACGDADTSLEEELGLTTPASTLPSPSRFDEWKALTAPDGGSYPAQRYAAFLRLQPGWPLEKRISSRYERALLATPDPQARQSLCPLFPIIRSDLLAACAPFLPAPATQARRLWQETDMDASESRLFLSRFASFLTPDDELKRYGRLERTGPLAAAQQQLQRTPPTLRPLLAARLANHFATASADAAFQNSASTRDAFLLYYRLRYLRLHDRLDEAIPLWQQPLPGNAITALSPPTSLQWQDERTAFVRALLRTGRSDAAQTGLALLDAIPATEQTPDSHLLAGHVALMRLHDPDRAASHFQILASAADLNQRATGLYWMARTLEGRHPDQAASFYRKASALPTTFYGQLALAHLNHSPFLSTSQRDSQFLAALKQRLAALPPVTGGQSRPRPDLMDAATRLQNSGDLINATLFLTYLQGRTQNDRDGQIAIARLARSLHLPKAAILVARQLARQGIAFYPDGYPASSVMIPTSLPNGLMPALIRQESSMDEFAVSPRHALGLTQLLLPTAIQTARRHNLPYTLTGPLDLLDPNVNTTIGSFFMEDLHTRFGHVLPYALAAYNAGPTRSRQWQEQMNSPASPGPEDEDTLLRWLLLIPYKETRLYIEHIEADMSLYALLPSP